MKAIMMKTITATLVMLSMSFGVAGLAIYIMPLAFDVGYIGGGLLGFAALLAIYARITQAAQHSAKEKFYE